MKSGFIDNLSEKIMPLAAKIGGNRWLGAIRDGYIAVMPLVITASLFTLINSVILGPNGLTNMLFGNPFTEAQQLGGFISSASMSVLGLLFGLYYIEGAFEAIRARYEHRGDDCRRVLPVLDSFRHKR